MTDLAPRATPRQWLAGARPRTLPIAVAPVVAGSGLAFFAGGFRLAAAVLALVVSLALQVGVNYANDYSDGIRGADADRVGPVRLVGAGLAAPAAVKRAALTSFAVAGVAGLGLVIMTGHWWLLGIGAACVLAAWYYTGGRHPYGYHGLGEVFVFVFFGLVAVGGTAYVQVGSISWATLLTGVAIGALACAILVVNNLRDIIGDTEVGKRTLATRLGPTRTRALYAMLVGLAVVMIIAVAALTSAWALLGVAGLLLLIPALRTVLSGGQGAALVAVLKTTGLAELVSAAGLTLGLVLATAV
jgi:1,4-dihydroxy-2-naphthoate polyprenyltransferase